jgi:hypothetical protein
MRSTKQQAAILDEEQQVSNLDEESDDSSRGNEGESEDWAVRVAQFVQRTWFLGAHNPPRGEAQTGMAVAEASTLCIENGEKPK